MTYPRGAHRRSCICISKFSCPPRGGPGAVGGRPDVKASSRVCRGVKRRHDPPGASLSPPRGPTTYSTWSLRGSGLRRLSPMWAHRSVRESPVISGPQGTSRARSAHVEVLLWLAWAEGILRFQGLRRRPFPRAVLRPLRGLRRRFGVGPFLDPFIYGGRRCPHGSVGEIRRESRILHGLR